MQAVIMAGGKGTRMRPYTNILPKPLLPIGNNSILELNIQQLSEAGIDNIIIAVGYLGQLIENVIGDGERFNLKINYSYEHEPLGTVGAIAKMKHNLEDNFIVMNGDILTDIDYKKLRNFHLQNSSDVTISTYTKKHKVRLGVLKINDYLIEDYIEKPTTNYNVSMGIYFMDKKIVNDYIIENEPLDFPNLIKHLIKYNKKCFSFKHKGLWIDLGTSQEYISLIDDLDNIKKMYPHLPIETNR